MKKRGASEVIVFVLLVGFAVTTAIIVINWSTKHTKELTEYGIEFVEKNIECEKIGINVRYAVVKGDCSSLIITNKGYLIIDKLITRSPENNKIEVIPIIILEETNKEIGCKEKSVILDCDNPPMTVDKKIHTMDLIPNQPTTISLP